MYGMKLILYVATMCVIPWSAFAWASLRPGGDEMVLLKISWFSMLEHDE
jgi:hypothetical protein